MTAGTYRRAAADALRDVWPVLLAITPFGLLIGVTISRSGVGTGLGLGSALLFFAGSAHLAALTLLAAGAGPTTVLAVVLMINARLALYGADLQPHFAPHGRWFRWLAPHLLLDQTYALVRRRTDLTEPARFRGYWLTAGAAIGVVWSGCHIAGVLLGPVLPARSPLEITAPAMFVALLVPHLRHRPAIAATVVGGIVAAAASVLPWGTGQLAGIGAGLLAGALAERVGAG